MTSTLDHLGTLWNAPTDARCPALEGMLLTSPSTKEAEELMRAARDSTRERARAYETPVREETLRRSVPSRTTQFGARSERKND
jgi:hypothetical protein